MLALNDASHIDWVGSMHSTTECNVIDPGAVVRQMDEAAVWLKTWHIWPPCSKNAENYITQGTQRTGPLVLIGAVQVSSAIVQGWVR